MCPDSVQNRSDTFDVGGELTVHRLGFGAMRLTGPDVLGEPADGAAARTVLERAVAAGIDFIDTADAYGPGTSERLIRETLAPYPDDLVIATKAGRLRAANGDWRFGGEPKHLEHALLCSLDRLGLESIDLYQYHRPDPDVPFEDSVTRLAELRDRGLIGHVGLSNVSVDQLDRARDLVEIATVQNEYSVVEREHEDVLRACEEADVGFVTYRPIVGLDRKAAVLDEIAAAHDATRRQVALAWLLQHSPVVIPIPGTGDPAHLAENVRASEIELSDEEMQRLSG